MRGARLVPGIYDELIDRALDGELARLPATRTPFSAEVGHDDAATAVALARIVHDRLLATLRSLPDREDSSRVEQQVRLTNELLLCLATATGDETTDQVLVPARKLLAIVEATAAGLAEPHPPERPEIPLGTSDLLVNAHRDVRIGTELVRELASADQVDMLCSFLKHSGVRVIEDAVRDFLARRPGGLRILTTAYMGATDRRALDALVSMGARLKVSYDTDRTRLHAKAWLFHRESGFTTGFVGSSNLSHAAMLDGLEWNVRLSRVDNEPILRRFEQVFEHYWTTNATFEEYLPERWDAVVDRQTDDRARLLLAIHVEPKPHQAEVLERVAAERERGHTRNLIVAATGTGKTFISAFDYRRLRDELGGKASLLFVAHRHELLEQSLTVFRVVLQKASFGARLGNGETPRRDEHVFANIQSLHRERLEALAPDAYDVVIVDEFHHAASDTYDALLRHLRPKYLIGLTATPERNDGRSVLHWFDGRIAAELRLWRALDQGLLSPFQYFATSDNTDLRGLRWTSTGYDPSELRNLYTANDLWIRRVLQEVHRRVTDPMQMRALGFCVDIEHARFCARRFGEAGLASMVLSRHSTTSERAEALARLQAGELRCIFSVDLLNEGVDVPDVDTVLFLRPTESATVFLQQLGRGLRLTRDKDCLTVLDFVGTAHRRFRFDARFRALVGGTRQQIVRQIERGFPNLPAGCSIQLDRVAADTILTNIRESVGRGDDGLVEDLQALGDVSLATFLQETGLELEDVYVRAGRSFSRLRRRAKLDATPETEGLLAIERRFARLLHIDDPDRLHALHLERAANASDAVARMLFVALGWTKRSLDEMASAWDELRAFPSVMKELTELFALLDDRRGSTHPLEGRLAALPLRVHATYGLDEVMAAIGERTKTGSVRRLREGIFHSKNHRADLLFVTLEKSEAEYSPSTMYRDFVMAPQRFHWESQSGIHADTETGRRYIEHVRRDQAILLFLRQRRETRPGVTAPYAFLGPCRYVKHEGARPMAIEWHLERPMPAWLYQETKLAAG
ncbi:MAG: DUF3427 domain-containing protein [Labilithrix sp.]|nr:DUF3427 domain-containing protein [Labilithrix sp.]MCW5809368.1 DUF3427 domain-containing protein [Labilithrix sp.]